MLIRFQVANYLSFDEMQEFTTQKGRPRSKNDHVIQSGKLSLLKYSALYGANAAGKSNFIQAMADSRHIIVDGVPSPKIGKCYFKIKEENKQKPSFFEYEFEINGVCYAYGFEAILVEGKIIGEWLYHIVPGKENELIYLRHPMNETMPFELGKKYKTNPDLQTYIKGMTTNTMNLFLKDINFGKQDLFKNNPSLSPLNDVYQWFVKNLVITMAGSPIDSHNPSMHISSNIELTNQIISSLGLGIETIDIKVENRENYQNILPADFMRKICDDAKGFVEMEMRVSGKRPDNLGLTLMAPREFLILELDTGTFEITALKRLQFHHKGSADTIFDYAEESDGTRIILNLLDILFAANDKNSEMVFVIDEIDRGLHPLLSHRFIDLFLKLSTGKTQLIVTTHETHLMDLDMVRQDEIWMISKQDAGNSVIESLDKFNVRFDKKLSKGYLDGLYNGIPIIKSISDIDKEDGGKLNS